MLDMLLLVFIGLILAVNVAVVAGASRRDRGRWPLSDLFRRRAVRPAPARAAGELANPWSVAVAVPDPGDDGRTDASTAAAIEAFVAGVGGTTARDVRAPVAPPARVTPEADRGSSWAEGPEPYGTPIPAESAASAEATSLIVWDRLLHDEAARVARFGRPVTVVYLECPGLEIVAERLGRAAADRIAAEMARLLNARLRETDRAVRLGAALFGVLLVETDELDAHLFAERVRVAVDGWLETSGLSVRVAIGLASPGKGRDLGLAKVIARERMNAAGPGGAESDAAEEEGPVRAGQAGNGPSGARHPSSARARSVPPH